MRFLLAACIFALCACSSTPVETAKVAPKPDPVPRSGRAGIQSTFPSARGWASDAEPLTARNIHLNNRRPAKEGEAFAWEVTYVSPSANKSRTFMWSAVTEDGLNEGVFGGPPQSWRAGSQRTILMSGIKIDTAQALEVATESAKTYLAKKGDKPRVSFMLEFVPRYNATVWRVMWGITAGTSEYTVFVDADSGKVLGRA